MIKRILTFFILFLFLPFMVPAQLKLASIFGDNMILQRNKPILIWGFNSPQTLVKIKFADQEKEVKTNELGRWEVIFPARNLGAPLTLIISDQDEVIRVSDILMGEVWLCSGQSNMEWKLRQSLGGEEEIKIVEGA